MLLKINIRNTFLLLIFSFSICSAHAEWIATGKTDKKVNYLNLPAKKIKNILVLWELTDYSSPQSYEALNEFFSSTITNTEIDCKNETFRLSAVHFYEGNMQTGKIIRSSQFPANDKNYEMFQPVIPNSQIEYSMEIACNKIKYLIKDKVLYPLNK